MIRVSIKRLENTSIRSKLISIMLICGQEFPFNVDVDDTGKIANGPFKGFDINNFIYYKQ